MRLAQHSSLEMALATVALAAAAAPPAAAAAAALESSVLLAPDLDVLHWSSWLEALAAPEVPMQQCAGETKAAPAAAAGTWKKVNRGAQQDRRPLGPSL